MERIFNKYTRKHFKTLERRLWHLEKEISESRTDVSYMKQEASALAWALTEIAIAHGEVWDKDLEAINKLTKEDK